MKLPNWIINIILKKLGVDKMFAGLQAFLSGKKTYLVAVAAILAAAVKFSSDGDLAAFITAIFAALGTMTMRAAVAK